MKRIKLSSFCTAALMLTLPLAGCMGGGDSGSAFDKNADQQIEMQTEENGTCPDGKCPENSNGKDGKCPDGKCPASPVRPIGRHDNGNGRKVPLPAPHKG